MTDWTGVRQSREIRDWSSNPEADEAFARTIAARGELVEEPERGRRKGDLMLPPSVLYIGAICGIAALVLVIVFVL